MQWVMFVQASISLPLPVTLVRERLLAYLHDDARLQPDTWEASEQAATLLPWSGVDGVVVSRVTAHSAPAQRRGVSTVIPIWWTPADPIGAPVPSLDATLELDPRWDSTSQLTLCGRYVPVFTSTSAPADRRAIGPAARVAIHSYLAAFTRAVIGQPEPVYRAASTGRPAENDRVAARGSSSTRRSHSSPRQRSLATSS